MAFGDNQIDGYPDGEEPVVFHYKQGDFRKREQKQYSDLATGKNQPKKGLFRVLVNTKGNRIMFFTMVFCFALVLIVSLLTDAPNERSVKGVDMNLSAFSIENSVYASLKLRESEKAEKIPRKFSVQFIFYDTDGSEQNRMDQTEIVEFTDKNEYFIRSSCTDFNIQKVECIVTCDSEKPLTLKAKVQTH